MSKSRLHIIQSAISEYLENNGYTKLSPNLLNESTQQEISVCIEKALAHYMGKNK